MLLHGAGFLCHLACAQRPPLEPSCPRRARMTTFPNPYHSERVICSPQVLLEYGTDWYDTFVAYFPSAKSIFFGAKEDRAQVS